MAIKTKEEITQCVLDYCKPHLTQDLKYITSTRYHLSVEMVVGFVESMKVEDEKLIPTTISMAIEYFNN
jgi:hypothetical protein